MRDDRSDNPCSSLPTRAPVRDDCSDSPMQLSARRSPRARRLQRQPHAALGPPEPPAPSASIAALADAAPKRRRILGKQTSHVEPPSVPLPPAPSTETWERAQRAVARAEAAIASEAAGREESSRPAEPLCTMRRHGRISGFAAAPGRGSAAKGSNTGKETPTTSSARSVRPVLLRNLCRASGRLSHGTVCLNLVFASCFLLPSSH